MLGFLDLQPVPTRITYTCVVFLSLHPFNACHSVPNFPLQSALTCLPAALQMSSPIQANLSQHSRSAAWQPRCLTLLVLINSFALSICFFLMLLFFKITGVFLLFFKISAVFLLLRIFLINSPIGFHVKHGCLSLPQKQGPFVSLNFVNVVDLGHITILLNVFLLG